MFLPYNYLIDPRTRGGLSIAWENAVLIFDEAHNVEVRWFRCWVKVKGLRVKGLGWWRWWWWWLYGVKV